MVKKRSYFKKLVLPIPKVPKPPVSEKVNNNTKKAKKVKKKEKKKVKKKEKKKVKKKAKNKTKKKKITSIRLTTKKQGVGIRNDKKRLAKIKTGISGFDKLLDNGIPEASSVLVEGGPGSGKTIFCLQLAHNLCKRGKKVLYMSFEEPEGRLKEHMRDFNWHPEEFEKKGLLVIKRFSALDIARSVEALLSEAKKELLIEVQPMLFPKDFDPDFVMIDSLTSIASAFSGEESRFRVYMEQLFRYLERTNITSFLVREVSTPSHVGATYVEKGEAVSFLSDGIIILYDVLTGSRRNRAIEILKMRGEGFKKKIVHIEIIARKGIVVYPEKEVKGERPVLT